MPPQAKVITCQRDEIAAEHIENVMLCSKQRGKRNDDEDQDPKEFVARVPTTEKQGNDCCNINVPAGKCIIPSPRFMDIAQKVCKEVIPSECDRSHVRGEKNKSKISKKERNQASRNKGAEEAIFCFENDPCKTGCPEKVAQHIRQNPYGPDRENINGKFWFDPTCNAIAGGDVDHLNTAYQSSQRNPFP